jgi:hypothetical protein
LKIRRYEIKLVAAFFICIRFAYKWWFLSAMAGFVTLGFGMREGKYFDGLIPAPGIHCPCKGKIKASILRELGLFACGFGKAGEGGTEEVNCSNLFLIDLVCQEGQD